MITPVKTVDIIRNHSSNTFQIVQKYESVDALWGIEHRKLTDDDIKALKEGKYLYCNNGEYAQIISYEPQESENKEEKIVIINQVLDDIRSKIDSLSDSKCDGTTVTVYSWNGMKRRVLDIIDKYKVESEEGSSI